jgi:hypothetical protein
MEGHVWATKPKWVRERTLAATSGVADNIGYSTVIERSS